jgi:hypothetical protein
MGLGVVGFIRLSIGTGGELLCTLLQTCKLGERIILHGVSCVPRSSAVTTKYWSALLLLLTYFVFLVNVFMCNSIN